MSIIKNNKKKLFFVLPVALVVFLCAFRAEARENVTDWYIQDFKSEITVNKDSSLDITEFITADCGKAFGKHGIFRILPEKISVTDGSTIKTPVELKSITDFNGKEIDFSESRSYSDRTVTWKIGDPNRTVQGVNYYKIHYIVKNTVRFGNLEFDELYWNLNGNFWDLETDKFQAKIIFPKEINEKNSRVEYYTGYLGEKGKNLAAFQWSSSNVLEFNSAKALLRQQGITASITFPKNIVAPYQPGYRETYGPFLFFLIPLLVFISCFYLWWR